ncbi:hypothetical protein LVJ94_35475 [Pendulispora rubella]|uniref:Uncharacterized protein n=1 Tax=Pendulispora rubella TaxID=2741070 RepID=A0ABZ2KY29_9BACT
MSQLLHARWLLPFAAVAAVSLCAPSHAEAASEDTQLERLNSAGHTLKWNWNPPGRQERYGHAETLVQAPLAGVRTQVLDFSHYKDLSGGKFKQSRMVGKEGGNTDVYFQVPVMKGLLSIWYVSRFTPPQVPAPGVEMVEGRFVRGNIKDMHIQLKMRQIDERFTVMSCDLYVEPNLPAPQSAVDEELRDACKDAVEAIRDKSQGFKGDVPFVTPPASTPPAARAGQ